MRTIKFRGRLIGGNEWLHGSLLKQSYKREDRWYIGYVQNGSIQGREIDPDTIGEYTGINDALDREIYEGDIVKIDGCPEKGNLIVVFYEGSFALATPKEYASLQQGAHPYLNDYARLTDLGIFDYQGLYRVLGNITDNPELIKEG